MEGTRASGEFSRAMNSLNHEITKANGLLVNLNRGFGSFRGELANLAGAFGTLPAQVGNATAAVGALVTMLGKVRTANATAGAGLAEAGAGAATAARGFTALSASAALIIGIPAAVAAIGLALYALAKPLAEATDLLVGFEQRFVSLSGSASAGAATLQNTISIANRLGVELQTVGNVMTRFTMVGSEIGMGTSEIARLTESMIKLGKLGGASQQELAAGLQ